MAGIGWLALLQLVPWTDVIKNAPKAADGAKKLWQSVRKKPPSSTPDTTTRSLPGDIQTPLQTRMAALEQDMADLHAQMLESAALIQTLAEQNTQLVQRAEASRVRLKILSVVTLLLTVAVVWLAVQR
ncbi:MAG: hypothetical protein H7224_01310 [Polaromonas sp.]|nr:hypothetical protein [Polaromonas sp.]